MVSRKVPSVTFDDLVTAAKLINEAYKTADPGDGFMCASFGMLDEFRDPKKTAAVFLRSSAICDLSKEPRFAQWFRCVPDGMEVNECVMRVCATATLREDHGFDIDSILTQCEQLESDE